MGDARGVFHLLGVEYLTAKRRIMTLHITFHVLL